MYLSDDLVETAFKRLSLKEEGGKVGVERTSALMYFLAYDAIAKKLQKRSFNLDPNNAEGLNNRKEMELEFERCVLLSRDKNGRIRQVKELGKIEKGGTPPGKRISSNFLTVPLKKASQSSDRSFYPKRPAPVLEMGLASTGLPWGITAYENWNDNFPLLLSDVKSRSPFTDLAIFLFRYVPIINDDLQAFLIDNIRSRFTEKFATFWKKRICKERMFFKYKGTPFQDDVSTAFQATITFWMLINQNISIR